MKKINTVITGSVLAAGVAASLFGAGAASAAPGVAVSVDGHTTWASVTTAADGAQASSTKGNVAVAVSTFGPSRANANGTGKGNVALAADSGPDSGPTVHPPTSAPTSTEREQQPRHRVSAERCPCRQRRSQHRRLFLGRVRSSLR